MKLKKICQPITIGNLEFKNRMVMPPLVIWKSDESAEVKDIHLKHYASCAGPGLMIVEATTVSPEGKLHENQLGIFDDRHIEGLTKLASTILNSGAVPGIQIHHAGGRATPTTTWGPAPLAPSTDGKARPSSRECRALTTDEINRIQQDFVAGALRAVQAGFKVIELHGAHAYLGSQFLSPLWNTRTDEYGGSLENRQRFLLETFRMCRDAVDGKALLSCRLGVQDRDEGGLTIEEGIDTAQRLEAEGAQLLHISFANKAPEHPPGRDTRFNPILHLAAAVRPSLSIPVIGVGGLVDPADAEAALENGMADLVATGRALLADPQWAAKVAEGRSEEINLCIRCPRCFWYASPEKCPVRKKHGNGLETLA
jgi:NADPH2 dehydrogenase